MYGGPSTGEFCAVCDERTTRGQAVLEIEFHRSSPDPGGHRYYFHPRCFAAWEFERTKVAGTADSSPLSI